MKDIKESINFWHRKATGLWNLRGWRIPTLAVGNIGTVAAYALYKENEIIINPSLYRQYQDRYHADTVPHEIAHLVNWRLHGKSIIGKDHGAKWGRIMWGLGLPPHKKHNFNLSFLDTALPHVCPCEVVHYIPATDKKPKNCPSCRSKLRK